MNDIYSFHQLISKYQIEIPIIQRDYAQGRNNTKAADVRKSLVQKMISAVNNDEPLFFDFVYGRVDGNNFIPFDGQQRLTTLFLFHKYVFEKCQSKSDCRHKSNCICIDILNRFSYATRQSSREFCEKLVNENVISSDSLTESVMNLPWFYPDWEKDPTVMGMLTMIDEIHTQMKGIEDFKPFAEKLTSGCNCPITFHFVDMGEHKLSDETYVKMNARGKQLTPFENFKASLEQYLGENSKLDLKDRLAKNVDGKWLDLFWDVLNQGKEQKELPDTLMMSFISRHFMNVWRCWYANNSKSENRKEFTDFNTRVQKEMPLYPTKDDFVSFNIYEYMMDKCGVECCLSPIFNILDVLCEDNNTIETDCQAIWNRSNGAEKWNLYEGNKNNNNRETYPSRVAFYALMKYFATNSDITALAQWMRVVWNIIENSTIDSPDTYHAALRLIENLSTKSHTIYDALANDFNSFELGNQYHAKEQVAEEIAKAKQIHNSSCGLCIKYGKEENQPCEEIIIESEKFAFFRGAIRFLFTDGEGKTNWNDFDTKWKNAQKYFDENGVKNEYNNNALLLRYYISLFKEWWMFWDFEYNSKNSTWKNLLTSKRYMPNHSLLLDSPDDKDFTQFNSTLDKYDEGHKEWEENVHNELVNTDIIQKTTEWNVRLNWRYNNYCLYPYNTRAQWKIYVIANPRNKMLSELFNDNKITSKQKINGCQFFWGWDISFTYKEHDFQWTTHNNVYLMENGERRSSFKTIGITACDVFIEKLEELISQADLYSQSLKMY